MMKTPRKVEIDFLNVMCYINNVLMTGLYNDFGIQVRNTLILLVEAQSMFSINIALRMLLYLAATYKRHVEEHKLNLYGTTAVTVPRLHSFRPRRTPSQTPVIEKNVPRT